MSISVIRQILKSDLPMSKKMVLVALSSHLREDNQAGECWPAVSTLAAEAGASDRTVQKALIELEQARIITRCPRDGHVTHYYVHPANLRKYFGGGSRRRDAVDRSATPAKSSGLPRRMRHETPEASSEEQGTSKKEKGGMKLNSLRGRSREAELIGNHLAGSAIPVVKQAFAKAK